MVGHVETLHPCLNREALASLESPTDGCIHVEVVWRTEAEVAGIAKRTGCVLRIVRRVHPLIELGTVPGTNVCRRARHYVWAVKAYTREGVVEARKRIDGEARFIAQQRRDLPIAEKKRGEPPAMSEMTKVDSADVKQLRRIVGARSVVASWIGGVLDDSGTQGSHGANAITFRESVVGENGVIVRHAVFERRQYTLVVRTDAFVGKRHVGKILSGSRVQEAEEASRLGILSG